MAGWSPPLKVGGARDQPGTGTSSPTIGGAVMKGIVGHIADPAQPAFNMDDVHRRTLDETLANMD